ncbi:MAG: division/cell wall cluster transcriptional repressor MraZ [Actinobacteria bacterium]|nr:division/cell wall cluster transcriptional repressor MraZ [Actinomycetota bacterium]
MAFFGGEFEHSLDEKGRIILPSKFRGRLEQLVISRGMNARCVAIYPPDEFQSISERLTQAGGKAREVARFIYSGASEEEPDKQGRVGIPEPLRRYAGLQREVTVIGVGNHIEIWDRTVWADRMSGMEEQQDALLVDGGDLPI